MPASKRVLFGSNLGRTQRTSYYSSVDIGEIQAEAPRLRVLTSQRARIQTEFTPITIGELSEGVMTSLFTGLSMESHPKVLGSTTPRSHCHPVVTMFVLAELDDCGSWFQVKVEFPKSTTNVLRPALYSALFELAAGSDEEYLSSARPSNPDIHACSRRPT